MDGRGYEESRFISHVPHDLLCCICRDVLRNPRLCQDEEHEFCLSCISQHLGNSDTCPKCRGMLTPETLKHPQSFLKNRLAELKIKCDYCERGCQRHLQLGNLQDHVNHCPFAPVMCEKCEMQVNRKDKDNHDKSFCQLGGAKCQDCGNIKANQDEMKGELCQVKAGQAEIKENQDKGKENQDDIKENQDVMKKQLNEIMNAQEEYHKSMNGKSNELKRKQDQMEDEMKVDINTTNVHITGMERKQDEINARVNLMKENVDEIKQTQEEMKADQVMFKAEVGNHFKRVTEMLNQLLHGSNVNSNGAHIDPAVPDNIQDIIILGGRCDLEDGEILNTVEKFNIVEGKSTQLPPMNHPRTLSASCVYNSDVIVTGGCIDKDHGTDTIEVLKMNQHPLPWTMFDGKLPVKLSHHVILVYQDKLLVIGGFNWSENKISDAIYELALSPPYTSKLLTKMPQPRRNHRAELVNGKLFILGGRTTGLHKDANDSVVVFDIIKNEWKSCTPLGKPVCKMSTVTWGKRIIVVGGKDNSGQILSDVIMYDTDTEESEILPSLTQERRGCSAVIMHDVIVVLGGRNDKQGFLNSVESFTMGNDHWKELPGMKENRHYATAVVKPCN